MLLLRDVHYVIRPRECRNASVINHETDTADLVVDLEWSDRPWNTPVWECFAFNLHEVAGAEYSAKGEALTWHTVHDCPHVKPTP